MFKEKQTNDLFYITLQISKILGVFQDQKMDIISCHDCQFLKCKSQITKLAWFDFKYKKVHIHRI